MLLSHSVLTFLFPNGTVVDFPVYCLTTSNSDYGTRVYRRNATRQTGDETGATTITFTGPGMKQHDSSVDYKNILFFCIR